MTGRFWLLVDVDPIRPVDTNVSDAEKQAARDVARAIGADLRRRGWPDPIVADSGNGYHLLYRVDLPNDTDARALVRGVLAALAKRFDCGAAQVDQKVFNASRISKVYGTTPRKGVPTEDRPHRPALVLKAPDRPEPVPVGLLEALAAEARETATPIHHVGQADGGHRPTRPGDGLSDVEVRAIAYLEKCDPAVSGQGGHDQTFSVTCRVGPGFDLPPETALRLLEDHYNPRCKPPWSDRELEHKVADAYRVEARRGWLLDADRPEYRTNGRVNGRHDVLPKIDTTRPNEAEDDPHRLARLYRDMHHSHPDGPTLRCWRDEFWAWSGMAWRRVSDREVRAELADTSKAEFDRLNLLALADPSRWVRGEPPKARKVTAALVGNAGLALTGYTLLASEVDQPAWLDGIPPWPVEEILPTRNALIHLPSFVEGVPCWVSPTPRFFSAYALDYDFDPTAPKPATWLEFLDSLWPNDPESVATLQEWFGYCLTADTKQQKILALIGPRRSGKGTIARTLKALVGPDNVAGPTLSGLAGNFGLAPLIGKPLAIVSDARLSGRTDQAVIVERLLSISGEDTLTIDRKHVPAWTGKLPTRFVLISNELPRLSDPSNALAGRLVLLRLTESYYGREDKSLTDKLLDELPGILLWSIVGWQRLRERGHFLQPESGREVVEEMEDLASPTGAFVRSCCEVGPRFEVATGDLYTAWVRWCEAAGRKQPGDAQNFGRNLRATMPRLTTKPTRRNGEQVRLYLGLRLRSTVDPGSTPY